MSTRGTRGTRGTRNDGELSVIQLLPNLMTVTAICAGLTAIRFGLHGRYELAVQLILLAGILDGLDGRLARALGSDSQMGAELDSLADFLNFGVAPVLVIYFWALQSMPSAGWLAVLIFAVCAVLRLARFNVKKKSDDEGETTPDNNFTGVPSPAGAILVMLPMFLSFSVVDGRIMAPGLIAIYMVVIGLLMISKFPTPSFKTLTVSRGKVPFVILTVAFAGAAVLTYPWQTLVVLCAAYIGLVVWGLVRKKATGS